MNLLPSLQARAAALFAGLAFRLVLIGIIAALFANTYVDVRIPLPIVPDLHWEGWKPKAERLQHTIDGFAKAQEQARILAEQQLRAKEAEYAAKARKADDEYQEAKAAAGDATARYIGTHRLVCPSDRGTAGPTPATAEDHDPGVPAGVPADALVAVGERDMHTVGDLYAYALSCRALVLDLGK